MLVKLPVRGLVFRQHRSDDYPAAGLGQHNPLFQFARIRLDNRPGRGVIQVDGDVDCHRPAFVEQQRRNFQALDLRDIDHDLRQGHQGFGHRPDVLLRLETVLLQELVHVGAPQQLPGQDHIQRRQGNLPVRHHIDLGTRGPAHHQRTELGVPGNTHTELHATHVLVGTLDSKAQEPAVREMLLVLLHQEATGVHDRGFAVELLHRALVAALGRAQVQERVAGLLVNNGNVHRPAFHRESFQHFLDVIAVDGIDGVDAIIPDHVPGFPIGQMQAA